MQIGTRTLKLPHIPRPRLPQPKTRVGKIMRGLIPLLLIAGGVYVVYNFPALKTRLTYTLNKPKPGNIALLPSTTRAESQIPANQDACGTKPIPYDANGN